MGYSGKLKEKGLAIELRKKGLSYSEIRKQVDISKDSLSRWCRDIILSPTQLERLIHKKLEGSEKGRLVGSKILQNRRIKETQELLEQGKKEVGNLNKRERFLVGIALYAGEGTKTDRKVSFANSDPLLIKFMASWFREFCNIEESSFRGALWIHENRNENLAKEYWSEITNIPIEHFHKSYIAENKSSSRKIRKHIHKYGIFRVGFSNSKVHRKIMGWIAGAVTS